MHLAPQHPPDVLRHGAHIQQPTARADRLAQFRPLHVCDTHDALYGPLGRDLEHHDPKAVDIMAAPEAAVRRSRLWRRRRQEAADTVGRGAVVLHAWVAVEIVRRVTNTRAH